eukprot:scaffold2046_cov171-Amphora_coffeaeformis.AAC.7
MSSPPPFFVCNPSSGHAAQNGTLGPHKSLNSNRTASEAAHFSQRPLSWNDHLTMCRPAQSSKDGDVPLKRDSAELAPHDKWLEKFDFVGFSQEMRALGKELEAQQGPDDVAHLKRMLFWSNSFAAIGLLSMGFSVNLVTIMCLSLYTCSRWTMIAHHTCHGGYENCHPEAKSRWSRFKFGLGSTWRRFNDWFDWMMPEAWNVEHNTRHHYNLSEIHDPDLVEENVQNVREWNFPVILKYIYVFIMAATWKFTYYAPNTYKELKLAKLRKEGKSVPEGVKPHEAVGIISATMGNNGFYSGFEFWSVVVGPYLLIHFILTPGVLYFVGDFLSKQEGLGWPVDGQTMFTNAVWNLFYAELLTNLHSFAIVVTNHAGDDMYRFRDACRPFSGSFFLRQVVASVDFSYGNDVVDFLHGWLNYQIEHHLWPNLSMLRYQQSAPRVRAICEKYGVPYVKQNVFARVKKTVDIMVGNTSMIWFPESYEKEFLRIDAELLETRKK